MSLTLYNTLSRKKEDFVPVDPNHVKMYVCGPTVYDTAHIGNARPVVVFDVLYRLLKTLYPKVTYVRNITDIDDKIIKAAEINQESIDVLTMRTTQMYNEDMKALNALAPDITPKATDHVSHMIRMIEKLIDANHAYVAEGHVLYHIASDSDYGCLSRHHLDDMIAGARVEVAPYKKSPADFVLWKPSTSDMPGWESPWGYGRPGWHIECSAMTEAYLGETFDIHGGGVDLIFPHHENEMAQSRSAHNGAILAKYWVHNGHLIVNGEKMSKSLGNFFTVREKLEEIPGEVIRYTMLATHYRQPLDWRSENVIQARNSLDRFYTALKEVSGPVNLQRVPEVILKALKDDMNIPLVMSYVHELASRLLKSDQEEEKRTLKGEMLASGKLLGILEQDPEAWFKWQPKAAQFTEAEIETLIQKRKQARADKDFKTSDAVRDELAAGGVVLEDGPNGTTWRRL
jgi:cysteinyl-tRNA synthetase